MDRRGFLRGLVAGVMVAPAIVKAENIMKIIVPKKEIILPPNMLHFGNMIWKPELVRVMPTTRSVREIQVQPSFSHIVQFPALVNVDTDRPRIMNASELVEYSKLFPAEPDMSWLDNLELVTVRF